MGERAEPGAADGRERRCAPGGRAAVQVRDDVAAPGLSYVIGRLDRALRTRLGEVLAPLGLTVGQFTTLSVLARRPGLSNAQLARRALILPQSMIQVISALEARGLVARTPARGRALAAALTPAGRALLRRGERATRALEAEMVGDLGPEELDRTIAVMRGWSERLAGTDPETAIGADHARSEGSPDA